ncbi:hypothetical protein AJ79_00294 [Helicocarpus griseus UAMH5409]|uniref:VPS9 domain-containing protein n=1 Tax=Helicocarpus griseus UAMH5409 TaxID=1447875 RepID=A0A2B7YD37_9EURO|nr:hypothetical protein AJ79_00294 [Helicocarpus griseus UAMH5409]
MRSNSALRTNPPTLYGSQILLVPVTESLVNARDRDSNLAYTDIVSSEEFLGSHVLRITAPIGSPASKDGSSVRESRGKARQITTVNGRTVVIKESSVYSNKGFKSLNQAQLLSDVLYYTSNNESQPWLIYYISNPLIGTFQPIKITPAIAPGLLPKPLESPKKENNDENHVSHFSKKEIKSFAELLANFPMIERQMQPGLDRLFREFGKELGKPLPPPPSLLSPVMSGSEAHGETGETGSRRSRSADRASVNQETLPFNSSEYFEDDEDLMRRALETAVTAAIDLFRLVDKQQLSLLGATTDLTGPLVERLIEKHVAQQVHDSLLFPRLCGFRQAEDAELDARIRQMENIDVSQVGIAIEGGRQGKHELINRLGKGVDEFRKITDAKCPQDMLEVLLATIKVVTIAEIPPVPNSEDSVSQSEKQPSALAMNADVLVSLLLVVIIRSQVRHLQARLLYMQQYIYTDDVEGGELGYALSTFEAVLTYLMRDSGTLRRASARNKRLWTATKTGRVSDIKAILDPDSQQDGVEGDEDDISGFSRTEDLDAALNQSTQKSYMNGSISDPSSEETHQEPEVPPLAHVFPFQTWSRAPPSKPPQSRKKVSMDMRSLSESSTVSFLSRTTTLNSTTSALEGDTSIENLTKTQDPAGDSVPMMAVEARQPEALKYLLSWEEYYPLESVLEDTNSDGTTLLSAAVQLAHTELVDIILDFVCQARDPQLLASYYAKADRRGRTVAHYLFSVPPLMSRLGCALPWCQRDKNGQTPLFALCRSYDHPDYISMVNEALTIAQKAQGDGKPLRLEDHVDAKGNTLLHVVSDPHIIVRILTECDCDPNATNDKRFTPLMMASKYGRVDLVRTFFGDPRVDVHVREMRGLTAVELAKDDEVRNKIDDLILFSSAPPSPVDLSGRITTVVRSLFVEDASVRFIIKSGAPNPEKSRQSSAARGLVTYTITTCRRSIADFENLVKLLKIEHPASYIPELPPFRSPFQIPSKPSRAVLHEIQERLDLLLKILLSHPTFATHEMLWEFFLVPEMQTEMIEERSRRKADALAETIADDYAPITKDGIRDVEQIVSHAQDAVRAVSAATRSLIRRGHILQHAYSDFTESVALCTYALSSLQPPSNALPTSHVEAFARYVSCISTSSVDSSPLVQYLTALSSSHSTTTAILTALARPGKLISNLNTEIRALTRAHSSLASSSLPRKFNFPGLEESRQKSVRDLEQKIADSTADVEQLEKEISWNKDVVVGELAGWTSWREKVGRDAIRAFVRTTLVRERERGRGLERCLRGVRGKK